MAFEVVLWIYIFNQEQPYFNFFFFFLVTNLNKSK